MLFQDKINLIFNYFANVFFWELFLMSAEASELIYGHVVSFSQILSVLAL